MTHQPPVRPVLASLPLALAACLPLAACQGPITAGPTIDRQALLAETSKQQELVFKRMVEDQARLTRLSFPLLTSNTEFCDRTTPMSGIAAWNLYNIGRSFQGAAASLYGLGDDLVVHQVTPGSPAAAAGIQAGDVIVSVNGERILPGRGAGPQGTRAIAMAGYNPIEIVVERNGTAMSKVVTPVRGCNYPVLLNYDSNDINAYADGNKIVLSKGIVRFAENDRELALVIAHELAHNALHHVDKMQQNVTVGALGGLAVDGLFAGLGVGTDGQFSQLGQMVASDRYSIPFEQEADYVGMYFMARAGYSIDGVADFWRRMGAENASSVTTRSTHPTSPERFIAIDRTAAEIAAKKKRGEPLVPNMNR